MMGPEDGAQTRGLESPDGFEAPEGVLHKPPVPVSDDVRDVMVMVLAAMVCGATPEEISGYLSDGFPGRVTGMLERPHERDEMGEHVDLLLCVQQVPSLATAPG